MFPPEPDKVKVKFTDGVKLPVLFMSSTTTGNATAPTTSKISHKTSADVLDAALVEWWLSGDIPPTSLAGQDYKHALHRLALSNAIMLN